MRVLSSATNLYWSELPAEKHLLYVPNNGHSLKDSGRFAVNGQVSRKSECGKMPRQRRLASGPVRPHHDCPP
ncbi:MAG: hypothetical protein HY736_23780 [Verrucomicrobia bacterium]|nr:hypothetical protein [Verrucomicrobiota bacterium]